jgi:hypothetical protein
VWRLSHALCAPGLDQLLSARGRVYSKLDAKAPLRDKDEECLLISNQL